MEGLPELFQTGHGKDGDDQAASGPPGADLTTLQSDHEEADTRMALESILIQAGTSRVPKWYDPRVAHAWLTDDMRSNRVRGLRVRTV